MIYNYEGLLDRLSTSGDFKYEALCENLRSLEDYIKADDIRSIYIQNLFKDEQEVIYVFSGEKIIKLTTEPIGHKLRLNYRIYRLKDIIGLTIEEQPKYTNEVELKITFKEDCITFNSLLDTNEAHQRNYYDLIKQIGKEIIGLL